MKPVFATGFKELISAAQAHPRRRRMIDFTRSPSDNGLQNLMNVWTEGSYSPVHLHEGWAETRVSKLALGRDQDPLKMLEDASWACPEHSKTL